MITVLITAVGTGVGQSILKGLKLARRAAGRSYRIIGVDISEWAAGLYRCDKSFLVPPASREQNYIRSIINIAKSEKVDIIIPGCDPELPVLAKWKGEIEEKGNCRIVVGSVEAIRICRDKFLTYKFLKEHGFACPETVLPHDEKALKEFIREVGFPVLIKPRSGSGTRGVRVVFNWEELKKAVKPDSIVQDYLVPDEWGKPKETLTKKDVLEGDLLKQTDEYSTEVLVSKEGDIIGSITNWRTMKKGYPIRAIIDDFAEVRKEAEKVVSKLIEIGLIGPCNLQARIVNGRPAFFEINPRFSGSTAIRCVAGFNGPDVIVRNFVLNENPLKLRKELKIRRLIEIRWWSELYIEPEVFELLRKTRCLDKPESFTADYF